MSIPMVETILRTAASDWFEGYTAISQMCFPTCVAKKRDIRICLYNVQLFLRDFVFPPAEKTDLIGLAPRRHGFREIIMAGQSVTFTIDGKNYTGEYELLGHGETAAVSVLFESNSISAFAGHLNPEVVARTLLSELVRAQLLEDGAACSAQRAGRSQAGPEPLHYRYSRPAPTAGIPTRPPARLMPRSASVPAFAPPMAR